MSCHWVGLSEPESFLGRGKFCSDWILSFPLFYLLGRRSFRWGCCSQRKPGLWVVKFSVLFSKNFSSSRRSRGGQRCEQSWDGFGGVPKEYIWWQKKWLGQEKREQWFVTVLPPQSELGSPDCPVVKGHGMFLFVCAQAFPEVKCEKQDMDFHVKLPNMDKTSRAYEWKGDIYLTATEIPHSKITLASPSLQAQPTSGLAVPTVWVAPGWVYLWIGELPRKKSLRADHPLALAFLILRAKRVGKTISLFIIVWAFCDHGQQFSGRAANMSSSWKLYGTKNL